MGTRILLVDDPSTGADLLRLVQVLGHDGVLAGPEAPAAVRLREEPFDLCLADVCRDAEGIEALLAAARECRPAVPIVALTAGPTVRNAVAALRAGAIDFLSRPFHTELFAEVLRRALGGGHDGTPAADGASVLGEHPAVRLMLERIDQVAGTDANILIRAEAGTGKQMIARLVHAASARRGGPFVAVSAVDLPEAIAEGALFGDGARGGLVRQASRGTLFIDEVSALPAGAQARLLRVLQQHSLTPADGGPPIPVDVRVIAASSRNLEPLVREGAFNDDLYYRLDVVPIEVPALRDRPEDISLLADHFRRQANARADLAVPELSAEVSKRLSSYDWPGNIRQLESTVSRLVHVARDREVILDDLPASLRADVVELGVGTLDLPPFGVDLRLLLTRLEERLIGQALQRTGGNKNRAAELLGMNRTTLVEKLRRRSVA